MFLKQKENRDLTLRGEFVKELEKELEKINFDENTDNLRILMKQFKKGQL